MTKANIRYQVMIRQDNEAVIHPARKGPLIIPRVDLAGINFIINVLPAPQHLHINFEVIKPVASRY